MKIAVNTRLLIKNKMAGIGWFAYHTLKEMTNKHPEHDFYFIFDRKYNKEFIFSDNITPLVAPPPTRHPVLWYLWFEHQIPRVLKKIKADIFLSPDGYLSLRTDTPSLPVIHDINFAHRPEDLPYTIGKYYNTFFPKFAHKGKRIATVSEYSKNDICSTYSIDQDKVDVVYNGSSPIFERLSEDKKAITKDTYTGGADYFVFVGKSHPRKNLARLFRAFDKFKQETDSRHKLVIVGGVLFKTGELTRVHTRMIYKNDVIFTGVLPPDELRNVVGAATAMTFVPYFEGFGVPIIEAMNCDVPVITANITSMPEVAGEAALLVDPYDVDSIKDSMLKIVNDNELRSNLIERAKKQREKFSWEKTSDRLWNSISKVI